MTKIREKFWGFRKQEVDDYFLKIQKAQEAELEDLNKKNEACERENESLRQEVNTLSTTQAAFPSEVLLDLAFKRMDRVLRFIDQAVATDVQAINKVASQKVFALENNIKEVEEEIEKVKAVIEVEIKNILEISRKREHLENVNVEDKNVYETKNIGKILPIADWLKINREEQPNLGKEFWSEEPAKEPKELSEQMTSDGTTLESTTKANTMNANKAYLNTNRVSIPNEPQVSDDLVKTISQEDNEEKKEQVKSKTDVNEYRNTQKGSSENIGSAFMDYKTDFWEVSPSSEEKINPSFIEVAATEESVAKAVKPDSSKALKAPETQSIPSEQSQAGVREEILTVRDKYIIGKVAGEDILDTRGEILIRKDEQITLNIMELAQKEGKLAELIIHMVLPGQEE